MSRIVQISEQEYDELLERSDFLACLEACGVDNWSGYDDAVEMFQNEVVVVEEVDNFSLYNNRDDVFIEELVEEDYDDEY